jgi:glycosyltransferase involved in cell wall biosynthesis
VIILVGSKIDQSSIRSSLGKPEYSYYFLMKDFLPVLGRLGTVIVVESLEEIDRLSARYQAEGETVIFMSVSPPHQTPLNLSCPTVTLFAWEFDGLPSVSWDGNPQNDWGYVFAHSAGAIATSREVAELVAQAAPEGFPVIALPAPVWDRFAALGGMEGCPADLGERYFSFAGIVIDSPLLGFSADGLVRKPEELPVEEPAEELEEQQSGKVPTQKPLIEAWQLTVALLKGWWREIRLPLDNSIKAIPVAAVSEPMAPQKEIPNTQDESLQQQTTQISVSGVVYTTVLNPADGRKNWVDLVTAFCWAFKHTQNATLVLKMTHHDIEHYRVVLMTLLSRLAPFRCRVLVLHGFLEDAQYRELIRASTYYVNGSTGEGLCLPLMEFLCSAKPVIAPAHTAMADYLNEQMAFLLKTSLEPSCWPHDPTGVLLAHKHRLNWQSLMEAFCESHRVALVDPAKYQMMSRSAYQQMRHFASMESVSAPLAAFFEKVLSTASIHCPADAKGSAK